MELCEDTFISIFGESDYKYMNDMHSMISLQVEYGARLKILCEMVETLVERVLNPKITREKLRILATQLDDFYTSEITQIVFDDKIYPIFVKCAEYCMQVNETENKHAHLIEELKRQL